MISIASRCYSDRHCAALDRLKVPCRDLYSVTMLFQRCCFSCSRRTSSRRDLYSVTMLFQLAKCLAFFVARGVVISIASRCYSNGREQGDPVERRGVVISIASRCYSNRGCAPYAEGFAMS